MAKRVTEQFPNNLASSAAQHCVYLKNGRLLLPAALVYFQLQVAGVTSMSFLGFRHWKTKLHLQYFFWSLPNRNVLVLMPNYFGENFVLGETASALLPYSRS